MTSDDDYAALRALIRPLVLEMHRRNLARLVIDKDGGQVKLGLYAKVDDPSTGRAMADRETEGGTRP